MIWGRRRQGKSTLALALALASGKRPVIVFDPCSQYTSFPRVEIEELNSIMEDSEQVIRVEPNSDVEEGFDELMMELDGGIWYWGYYSIIVDESSFLQKPQGMNLSLARLIRQAPDDITVIQTLHRPSETHPTVRALATDLFFFQTYLRRDLTVIRETYGEQVAEQVRSLGPHEVLHFWLGSGGEPQISVWHNPSQWYVPIRKEVT